MFLIQYNPVLPPQPGNTWQYLETFLVFTAGKCLEPRDAVKHPTIHRTTPHTPSPTDNYPAPNLSSVQVDKLCSEYTKTRNNGHLDSDGSRVSGGKLIQSDWLPSVSTLPWTHSIALCLWALSGHPLSWVAPWFRLWGHREVTWHSPWEYALCAGCLALKPESVLTMWPWAHYLTFLCLFSHLNKILKVPSS